MRKTFGGLMLVGLAVGLAACSDMGDSVVSPEGPALGKAVPGCDLKSAKDAARRYLDPPDQQEASALLRTIESATCSGVEAEAWDVIGIVERAAQEGTGGQPRYGAALANAVLDCCAESGVNHTVTADALSPGGLFGVRGASAADDVPVASLGTVEMTIEREDGSSGPADVIVVLVPTASWQDVLGSDPSLLYGAPLGSAPYSAYQLDKAPDVAFDAGLDVIFCFAEGETDNGLVGVLEHDGSIIPPPSSGTDWDSFCQNSEWLSGVASAPSPLSRLVHWASRLVLPQPLQARQSFRWFIGGLASDFSPFGAVEASPDGQLVFTTLPPDVVESTTTPFNVAVQALTGGGRPIPDVEVSLSLLVNNGDPAAILGSFADCSGSASTDPVACTDAGDGVADFDDITITKAGGYILGADGTGDEWSFTTAYSPQFHVKQ